ncbi:bifunctional aminoglycoside phosphotransferase/ATP-binding protein [endosymbiont of unidentified scaly snail isolate Monju]|uniref:bifunctional aminoglycoside phosphotransferase/ATP-binding protein n=1 Tax=endosymbiont of unidentified scaly snail isolate Monju TaxID=1248727 RepID=UPI0003891C5B|nr:bifunctional aminoglycoside phosphotransferase/ATP-binding protein [endosymbiont of unidentified scaly snail isolate Monju]BAN69737.1 conserved hypothetical protein [endosymbiont of unidentified scaly snail isolate Monju]
MQGNAQPPLIAGLLAGLPGARLIETHISWVILHDRYAWKLKKPLDLGFLDFSRLDQRRLFCEEEIRLNRRLAPDIYLGVVPITGTPESPRFGGEGPILEWAVQMRAFDADATLDRAHEIAPAQIDAIADCLAHFHRDIPKAPPESDYGTPAAVRAPVEGNFAALRRLDPPPSSRALLDVLEPRLQRLGERLEPHFSARREAGHIRECHGDLHLGNIAWMNEAPLIFDAIEFDPGLRFIDPVNELAFLAMDLHHRGQSALAWRLLDRWLTHTGDHAGLAAWSYYLAYRAMVRAKIAAIRARQADDDFTPTRDLLALADALSRPGRPALVLMHGVSGSGKTHLSQALLEDLGTVRLRSDVERKRLFGLGAQDDSRRNGTDIYTPEASRRTLATLLQKTEALLDAGLRVIVDATFLARSWREPFEQLAEARGLPWCIVSPQVPETLLRERVSARHHQGEDASEADLAVLTSQLANQQPLAPDELPRTLQPTPETSLPELIEQVRQRLRPRKRSTAD